MSFVHLHNHTQYSILDGACRTDKMVQLAKNLGMPAVAMTDHGNMFGVVDFYNKAIKANIKPIIGLEAYLVDNDFDHPETKNDTRYHLVLLVKNAVGYKNLMKLSSYSYTEGFYYKPRVSKSMLEKYNEGLICLSACIQGEIPQKLLKHSKEAALKALNFYKELFGEDFYIEIQDHGLTDERKVMPDLIKLAKETNTPLVVTNDCHYLEKKDAEAHDILLCIQTGRIVSDTNRMKYPDNMYFKTEEEMKKLFPDIPEAIENTIKIAQKIDFKLAYDDFLLPKIEIPEKYNNQSEYLKALCFEAVEKRYGNLTEEIESRINFELGVIARMGFDGYFLVVKDFIDAARERDVPVGPGRGSAAGSIIAYLLGITQLDPLKYNLFFERFLNPERIGMPDIDIDFCANGRSKVIDYVIEKYGRNSVTQIITYGTLGAKSVIKDVARVMEVPAQDANNLTKLMPSSPKISLDDCLSQSQDFAKALQTNPLYKRIFDYGKVIEGLIRQIGVHAAGVVIGPGDLTDYVPLAVSPQKEGDPIVLVQYEGKWLDDLKMLKMDFLGLKTLTIIKRSLELIKKYKNIDIDIENVDLFDKKAYELLSMGQTDGIFQFESAGMKKYLCDLKPNQFEDLIAMVALYRPGPMQFIDTYIKRKHGKEKVQYDHPLTENTLQETYGVTVYQEQVMQISREMGGFSGAEADTLRKAMGKKNIDLMNKLKEKFKSGSMSKGVTEAIIDKIWENWLEFAKYAFNKSHAACYAFVSFQTAYLKAHYPVEFMTALLSLEDDPDKIPQFIDVAKKMNIEILPPCINLSDRDFKIVENKILFGLSAIKNVGQAAVNAILSERQNNGEFSDYFNFVERVESSALNKSVLEALIMAGALDGFDGNRAQKFEAIENALYCASKSQSDKKRGQLTLFDLMSPEQNEECSLKLPDIEEWNFLEKLENEKKVLGFYISGHPLSEIEYLIDLFANINTKEASVENAQIPSTVKIIGAVSSILTKKDKRNNNFFVVTMEDMYGKFEFTLFNSMLEKFRNLIVVGNKLYITGSQSNFQGNNNSNMLRINPENIVTVEELKKNAKGDLSIIMNEEDASAELAEFILDYGKHNPGQFNVYFKVKTEKFRNLVLQPSRLTLYPDEKFVKEIKEKRKLALYCQCNLQ